MHAAAARPKQDSKGSLTFSAKQTFVRPHQRKITGLINEYHQAVADSDESERMRLRERIERELDIFDRTRGDGHQYPDWVRPVLRANALAAFGDLDEAIEYELKGAAAAEIDMHKAISANNLSDHYRRLGRLEEAVEQARIAYELWPENEGFIVNLALALHKAGLKPEAGRIISRLAEVSDLEDPRNILAAHLRFESEMKEMGDLPEVQSLLSRMEAARNREGG